MSPTTYAFVKRACDIAVSTAGLVVSAPIFGVVAAAIVTEDPGPVFFKQKRAGKDGQVFHMYKFRSMRMGDASQSAGAPANPMDGWTDGVPDDFVYKASSANDDRITKVGRFLRKSSLDELPQLINVFLGEMSLVGPRPEVLPIVDRYNDHQRRRLTVKPGVTGWAQINGRAEQPHGEKIECDLWYVDHASLATDVRILLRTALEVVKATGAR